MRRNFFSIFNLMFLVVFFISAVYAESEKEIISQLKSEISSEEKIQLLGELSTTAKTGSKRASKILITYLNNQAEGSVRSAAALAMGKLKVGRLALEKAFKIEDKIVRTAIIQALARISSSKSVKTLVDGFNKGETEEIKYWALVGLSRAGNRYHAAIFRKSLRKEWENPAAIEAAIYGLGRVGKASDWRYIKSFTSSMTPSYVVAALKAAGMLKAKDALYLIENKMGNENPDISKAAITALGSFGGYATIATLIRFKNENPAYPDMGLIKKLLKKNKAAKKYAILKSRMNLRKGPTNNSDRVIILDKNSVVKVLSVGKRKFTITDKSGQDLADFWYNIQDARGRKGYLFGAYIIIVNTYE